MCRLLAVVVTLLLGCVGSKAVFVDIGTPIIDLGEKVSEELSKEIVTGLKAAEVSIKGLTPTLTNCLGAIETRQAECSRCINTSCRQRLDTLRCPSVGLTEVSPCDVSSPVCSLKTTVQKATTTLQTIEKALKVIGERLLALAQKVITGVEKVIIDGSDAINGAANKVGSGLNAAAESIKAAAEKTVNQAVNVAEKAASEVEKAANKVAQGVNTAINTAEEIAKKAGKVIKAGAEDVADTVKDGVNAVKDFLNNIGRRRRLAAQPTCDAIAKDSEVCLFYQGLCEKCAVFGTNEAQSNILEVLLGVCGSSLPVEYDQLESLIQKADSMTNLAETFVLKSVKFDPSSLVNGLYQNVLLEFGDSVTSQTMTLLKPVQPFDIQNAGPAIATEIFNTLFS